MSSHPGWKVLQSEGSGDAAGGAHQPVPGTGVHRSENKPEFVAQALQDWCEASETNSTDYIERDGLGRTAYPSRSSAASGVNS
jgi:hypothetical protein